MSGPYSQTKPLRLASGETLYFDELTPEAQAIKDWLDDNCPFAAASDLSPEEAERIARHAQREGWHPEALAAALAEMKEEVEG